MKCCHLISQGVSLNLIFPSARRCSAASKRTQCWEVIGRVERTVSSGMQPCAKWNGGSLLNGSAGEVGEIRKVRERKRPGGRSAPDIGGVEEESRGTSGEIWECHSSARGTPAASTLGLGNALTGVTKSQGARKKTARKEILSRAPSLAPHLFLC